MVLLDEHRLDNLFQDATVGALKEKALCFGVVNIPSASHIK